LNILPSERGWVDRRGNNRNSQNYHLYTQMLAILALKTQIKYLSLLK